MGIDDMQHAGCPRGIVISCALQDAGEATRSLAIATTLRRLGESTTPCQVIFLTHGSRFEAMVSEAGFPLRRCAPRMEGRSVVDDLGWDPPEIIGSTGLARELISGETEALRELEPDLVLHGFWPFANIAARMLGIPTAAFLPLPLHPVSIAHGLLDDLPDEVPLLSRLPLRLRRGFARAVAPIITSVVPAFTQRNVSRAALEAGWAGAPLRTVFDVLKADLTVVNDLPEFYRNTRLPSDFRITGPIFARSDNFADAGPAIVDLLTKPDPRPRVLLTMGSSGMKDTFLAALRAVAQPEWRVVALASPAICQLIEARAAVEPYDGLIVTDAFVPAQALTRHVDVVVSHGGQGTVQTSLAAGVPTVGVGMQVEQQINLQHVHRWGAGVRVSRHRWRPDIIRQRLADVLGHQRYTHSAPKTWLGR